MEIQPRVIKIDVEKYDHQVAQVLYFTKEEFSELNLKEDKFSNSKILINGDHVYYASVNSNIAQGNYSLVIYKFGGGIHQLESIEEYKKLMITSKHVDFEKHNLYNIYFGFYSNCSVYIDTLEALLKFHYQDAILQKIIEKDPKQTIDILRNSVKESVYLKKKDGEYVKIPNNKSCLNLTFPDDIATLLEYASDETVYSKHFEFPYELQEVSKQLEKFFERFTSFVPVDTYSIQSVSELKNIILNNKTFADFESIVENESIITIALEQYILKEHMLRFGLSE